MRTLRVAPVVVAAAIGLGLAPAAASGSTQPPSLGSLLSAYAATREGSVSVAVYDDVAHQEVRVHPRDRMVTASIVKVDILQTLLHQRGGHLSEDERELATRMIEQSDNDAATDLWNDVGGAAGVARYNSELGLKQTHPQSNGEWGLTRTSAGDQVALVRNLLVASPLLSPAAQTFARYRMRHITSSQDWGVSAGPTPGTVVGLKNGWLPVASDDYRWEVNSIGWVRGDGRRYEIAILTAHQPSEGYGIQTIEHLSRLVWAHVQRKGRPST